MSNISKYKLHICHLAIIHDVYCDARIMSKMAYSSIQHGDKVSIITSNSKTAIFNNINIFSISNKFINRFLVPFVLLKVYKKACNLKADIYHIHEVPLMLVGLMLKYFNGRKIIIDFHEDFEAEIMDKLYLPINCRYLFKWLFIVFKSLFLRTFDGVILAEDNYQLKYKNIKNKIIVRNYPVTSSIKTKKIEEFEYKNNLKICYVGSISEDRGAMDLILAASLLKNFDINFTIHFIGPVNSNEYYKYLNTQIKQADLEKNIKFLGKVTHEYVINNLSSYHIGYSALHNNLNYRNSLPTKVLEYNLAGLPCIVSDLPISWDYVIPKINGYIIKPKDTFAIAEIIMLLYKDFDLYSKMRKLSRKHVIENYEWKREFKKLDKFYRITYFSNN